MSDLNIRVITESEDLESLSTVWEDLMQKCGDESSIFLTHEWISTWWRYFGTGHRLNILVFEQAGQVIGIIPLMIARYGIGPFKVDVLETIGATNCNYPCLIAFVDRQAVIEAFSRYLLDRCREGQFIVRLRFVPEDSQVFKILRENTMQFHEHLFIEERVISLAPYILLDKDWDEYFSSLGRRRRKHLRQVSRSICRDHIVEYKKIPRDSSGSSLDILFDLHQKRWQATSIRSPFSDPKMRYFYRDLTSCLALKDRLHFSCLSVDGVTASILYACIHNQRFYALTAARDLAYSKYSVGHLHEMHAIMEAIGNGLREYDFLRGDEPYKFYWTGKFRRYLRITIVRKWKFYYFKLALFDALIRLSEIVRNKHSVKELYGLCRLWIAERREKRRMGLYRRLK